MSKIKINKLTNANVYMNGVNLLGRAEEVQLPQIKHKMAEHKALGMVGSAEFFSGIDKLMVRNAPTGAVADQYLDFNKSGVIVIGVNADCIVSGLKVNDIIKEIRFTNGTTSETFKINGTYDFLYARLRMHDYKTATFVVERDGTNVELILNQG